MTVEELQYVIVEVVSKNNDILYDNINKDRKALTRIIERMTEMIMDLDARAKFDDERIKVLEHELFSLSCQVVRMIPD